MNLDAKESKSGIHPSMDRFDSTADLPGWMVDPSSALANEISQRSLIAAENCIDGVKLVEGDGEKQKTTSEYILRKNKGKVKKVNIVFDLG